VTQLNDLHERLRILLGILGEEFALQVQWSIDSDYRHELETYHRETLDLRRQDPVHGQFGVLIQAGKHSSAWRIVWNDRRREVMLHLIYCPKCPGWQETWGLTLLHGRKENN
jgi:hypothetical protein